MKIGIVVPFSWSFWGAVVEHAESQAAALEDLGHEVRLIMGNDPPGQFTRVLHPRIGRHGEAPPGVIPVGRSVIVPANGSLPNIVLSPRTFGRIRRALERERFDVLHLHEPMTPAICTATLVLARTPIVATFHASGELGWMRYGEPLWGFLIDRVDHRIAVSERARDSQARWLPGEYEVIPNGVLLPDEAPAGGPGAPGRLRGQARAAEGAAGAPPRLARDPPPERPAADGGRRRPARGAPPPRAAGVRDDGIDVVGFLSQEELTDALLRAKALIAPSLGQESFGMVLTRAYACALPVVASDIPGYREVLEPDAAVAVPPGDEDALVDAVCDLVADEPRRERMGEAARALAVEHYSWPKIAKRLEGIYEGVTGVRRGSKARAA